MIYSRRNGKRCILNCSQRYLDWIEGENCSVNHDISDGFQHTALGDSFGDIFTSEIYHWRKPLKWYLSSKVPPDHTFIKDCDFKLTKIKKSKSQSWLVRIHCLANLWSDLWMKISDFGDFGDLRHDIVDINQLYFTLGAPAVLHPAWASSGQHSSISKEREEKVVLQIRELSIHRRISSFGGKQLMATQSKAAQT